MTYASREDVLGNARHVQVGVDTAPGSITENERRALQQLGEPLVECGGDFTSPTFTLPSNQLRFPSQFPVKQIFDRSTNAVTADSQANRWRLTILQRIQTAMATKLAGLTNDGRWLETV